MDDEVMLNEGEGVLKMPDGCWEPEEGEGSEGGSSDGRLGVGSTVGGGGISVTSPAAVVVMS